MISSKFCKSSFVKFEDVCTALPMRKMGRRCQTIITCILNSMMSVARWKYHQFKQTLTVVVRTSLQAGENFSFFSIIYPVIGAPPVESGSFHFKSTRSTSQSTMSGVPGLPGISTTKNVPY